MRASATVGARRFIAFRGLHPGAAKSHFREPGRILWHLLPRTVPLDGAPERLNWSRKERENTYALGELVAEIGSCFLCRELGVPASENLENHIAYVGNWLQAMRSDPRFIFTASAQASKAADFILSFSRKPEEAPEPTEELVQV